MFVTIFETFTQMRLKRVRKLKIVRIIKQRFYEGPQRQLQCSRSLRQCRGDLRLTRVVIVELEHEVETISALVSGKLRNFDKPAPVRAVPPAAIFNPSFGVILLILCPYFSL